MSDSRFNTNNPLFKKSVSKRSKIKVDERFQSVLHDEKFLSTPGTIDKFGRKVKNSVKNQQKELSEFYEIDTAETLNNSVDETKNDQKSIKKSNKASKAEQKGKKSNNDESRLDYLIKLSRGEIENDSSSDDDDDDDSNNLYEHDNEEDDDDENYEIGERYDTKKSKSPLDVDDRNDIQVLQGDATKRLAIQNCDWENLKAKDLLYVFYKLFHTII